MADCAAAVPAPVHTVALRDFALAALAECAGGTSHAEVEVAFLRRYWERCGGPCWRDALTRYASRPATADEPLLALARQLRLTPIELVAAALCAAVEDDALIGRAIAAAQAPLGGSRPTLALLAAAVAPPGRAADGIGQLAHGTAVASGLLSIDGAVNRPLPERCMAMPVHLASALAGRDAMVHGCCIGIDPDAAVNLPASLREAGRRHAEALTADPLTALVVRSASHLEGRMVVDGIASSMGMRPAFIGVEAIGGLGPWASLRRLLPVFTFELAPGERRLLPEIPQYRGALAVLCGHDGTVEASTRSTAVWTLPVPSRSEREGLWQRALGDDDLAARLARDHRHGAGRIHHLGRVARHHARLNGRSAASPADVLEASWSGEQGGLDALAQPVRHAVPDDALITTPLLREQLDMLARRCRARDGLGDGLGVSVAAHYRPGVRALFVGPSGTGKTLAAGWLATRLGLPLYRVDLSAVTSKYIGETEKNLAQLLARAEQAEVLLLFDEADAVFGKRTDVRDANDRFANAQTNYLLQRIETFDGISILTSNNRARFDEAFSRRLDMVVEFPAPGPEERRALWLSHLGPDHLLDSRSINQLAALADLCGGEIRNAVLAAAVIAHGERRAPAYDDVVAGVAGEYRKAGRQMPMELRRRV